MRSIVLGLLGIVLDILGIVLVAVACSGKVMQPPAASAERSAFVTAPRRLAEIVRSYERERAPYFPFAASERGVRRYDRVLANDISEDYRSGLRELCTRHRDELRRLDASALDVQQQLTYEIFDDRLTMCVWRLNLPWHLMPVDQVGMSWPSSFPVLGAGKGSHPFKTVRNYEDFLGRVDGFVVWMDTAIANMRVGAERGITQRRVVIGKVLPQLDAQIVSDVSASPFWEPVKNFPKEFDADSRQALTEKYRVAIESKIVPAYRRLRAFIQDEYLPRCRTSYGISDIPGGRDMYAFAVRGSTTTDLTPDQIYEIGLREVQRISGEIGTLRTEMKANGDPMPGAYTDMEAVLKGYADFRSSVEAALPKLFGRFPRATFEIRPIEAFRERSMPSSYEPPSFDGTRRGVFYLNAVELKDRGRISVYPNLFLHEAVPGHHFQMTLQRENRDLPVFRKFAWYTAFGEGWALYAESLGTELGVYRHRHERLGMLGGELFRAKRLVVDVGLHDKGWTRERAIEYIGGDASSENAVREAERYMAWPGQALGYKIGQMKILEIRKRAEATLGASFDVRAFHDELLGDGAMPLSILERKMDRWIASRRRS